MVLCHSSHRKLIQPRSVGRERSKIMYRSQGCMLTCTVLYNFKRSSFYILTRPLSFRFSRDVLVCWRHGGRSESYFRLTSVHFGHGWSEHDFLWFLVINPYRPLHYCFLFYQGLCKSRSLPATFFTLWVAGTKSYFFQFTSGYRQLIRAVQSVLPLL